ncbi:hypothetical protein OAS39_02640 [Pirellulales bacterium]|nr:hypothetical protein [Pirellulales bacterium]
MTTTGEVESWAGNPLDIGPMYPFVGWEMPLFVVCVILCVAMTIWKILHEQSQLASEVRSLRQTGNGARILGLDSPENVPTQND